MLKLNKIYERLAFSGITLSEQKFCEYFNQAVEFFVTRFGREYVLGNGGSFEGAERRTDVVDVYDEFASAICDYIAVLSGDASKLEGAVQKGEQAYLAVWRGKSKGKVVKPSGRGEYHV